MTLFYLDFSILQQPLEEAKLYYAAVATKE